MKRSSLLAVETGPFDRVAADGRPWNLFWFFLKLGSRAILTSYIQKMAGHRSVIDFGGAFAIRWYEKESQTYVFAEALFVQVGCAFDFAEVVARALGRLVNLKRSLTAPGHLSAHERGRVLLELSPLRFHLELIIAEESGRVFFIDT